MKQSLYVCLHVNTFFRESEIDTAKGFIAISVLASYLKQHPFVYKQSEHTRY